MATNIEGMKHGLSASECPVCWGELGDERMPYSLTCGHTLCLVCIKRLSVSHNNFPCPLCREVVPLANIKRNVTLYQLLSQLRQGLVGSFSHALTTSFESIKLDQLLDRGASGEVYRGNWQENDVAIKVFSSGQLSPEAQESFRREVCVMNTLRHPNVVLLLAACPTPPRLAIVMEYVGGGSLYSHIYINKTIIEVETMAQLLIDVSRGLQYLHSINILHRDLKSKNVLLSAVPPHCQAKLCDFGLARMRLESATMTGNIGTVHWTAPEVLNCGRYQFSADIYSLGMVMYEVISGCIPFGNLPPPAVIVAVLLRRDKPRPPTDCNHILASLVDRCTSWDAQNRPSISAILRDLQTLLSRPDTEVKDGQTDIMFDHTDSLGHVMIDLELDDDTDNELFKFLLENQLKDSNNEDIGLQFKSTSTSTSIVSNSEKGGLLSAQELEEYHDMVDQASYTSSKEAPIHSHLKQRNTNRNRNEHEVVKYEDNISNDDDNDDDDDNDNDDDDDDDDDINLHFQGVDDLEDANDQNPLTMSTHSLQDEDLELALALQKEEIEILERQDYHVASKLYHQLNTKIPQPPPLPPIQPIPQIPLNQLPFRPSQKDLLFSQLKGRGKPKKLKRVKTVEKRAFLVGRVVDGTDSEQANFTLQKEVAAFNKKLLYPVVFQEPKPSFPVGRVLPDPKHPIVKPMVARINSQVRKYEKSNLKHTETMEKIILPTVDDLLVEKQEVQLVEKQEVQSNHDSDSDNDIITVSKDATPSHILGSDSAKKKLKSKVRVISVQKSHELKKKAQSSSTTMPSKRISKTTSKPMPYTSESKYTQETVTNKLSRPVNSQAMKTKQVTQSSSVNPLKVKKHSPLKSKSLVSHASGGDLSSSTKTGLSSSVTKSSSEGLGLSIENPPKVNKKHSPLKSKILVSQAPDLSSLTQTEDMSPVTKSSSEGLGLSIENPPKINEKHSPLKLSVSQAPDLSSTQTGHSSSVANTDSESSSLIISEQKEQLPMIPTKKMTRKSKK